jgi:lysylphosphatidylglycerol synthetase-like protein (DUF2156 family)
LLSLYRLLRPFIPQRAATADELDRARALVRRFGNDSLSYFALQDGRNYYFHESGEAFISYRLWGNVALVGGDPVGAPHLIEELVRSFLAFCGAGGLTPCFLGIGPASLPLYRSFGLKGLKIGEEAVIDLKEFDRNGLKRKVRRAARHSADLGITIATYRSREIPAGVRSQMQEISSRWVREKGGEEKGFSMTLGRLPKDADEDCEVVVAMHGAYVWGYLSMVPVYGADSWSLDAMRRRPESPNGLTEFMVIEACEMYRRRGFSAVSLNFATLSNSEDDIDSRALESTRRFLYEQLSGFYQLKSLYQFNSKFQPRWRSRYLAYADVLTFPKIALAVVQSEDPLKLPSLVAPFRR